ncbi:MAG: hypothetical protein ACP5UU_06030, partial [Thermoprotei archaeon]
MQQPRTVLLCSVNSPKIPLREKGYGPSQWAGCRLSGRSVPWTELLNGLAVDWTFWASPLREKGVQSSKSGLGGWSPLRRANFFGVPWTELCTPSMDCA